VPKPQQSLRSHTAPPQSTHANAIPGPASQAQQQAPAGNTRDLKPSGMPVGQAAVFVFLASDDASYVNGEFYGATGGRMPF
jgi:NAD(P)-dependent dehydrogenase (short-subunit alcohol dehydrogenase family)